MNEEKFWEIINLLNWNGTTDEDIIEPAVVALSRLDEKDIFKFEDILSEKLFNLDAKKYAENIGDDSYSENNYFSVDGFLYVRACVVANGREFYKSVVEQPTLMPKEVDFEPLLTIAHEAYRTRTGKTDFNHTPKLSYETFSNQQGWGRTKDFVSNLQFS